MTRHRRICCILLACICCLCFSITCYARAGGGSSGGSAGGSSGGTYHYNNESNYTDDESPGGWSQTIVGWMAMACFAGAGTIAFHCYIQKAKYKSLQKMKKFEKPGEDWNAKEMQKYVENAYFVIQECWRLLDPSYAEKYLSKSLAQSWTTKLEWMKVKHEKPIQKRVQLLSVTPVSVWDDEGEEDASIVYLIHGRMIGYYINTDTLEVVRGKKIPESFYEYWIFIREDGRWVLNEIQQKDEVDVHEL